MWSGLVRHPGRRVVLVDAAWALATLLLAVVVTGLGGFSFDPGVWLPLTVALVVPLAWRRVAPELVCGLVAVLQYAQLLAGSADVLPANALATSIALFTVTVHGRDRVWQGFLALALLGCALLGLLVVPGSGVAAATTVVGATLAGYLRRIVRVRDEAAVERARRLEVERDSAAAVAAERERRRIARDLHDVIAHSLTVIVAQADGGRYAARSDPEAAGRALGTVAATARVALGDLRAALGALRSDEGAGTAPLPGAADVPALVAAVRDSGHEVALTVHGEPGAVTGVTGLTTYRTVQESLTNVLKHAGPGARTDVEVVHTATGTRVSVTDDGVGSASRLRADGSGTGLVGMRERVEGLGGTFRAGPRDGGGWSVEADVPARAPTPGTEPPAAPRPTAPQGASS